jgi:hypothetical protein
VYRREFDKWQVNCVEQGGMKRILDWNARFFTVYMYKGLGNKVGLSNQIAFHDATAFFDGVLSNQHMHEKVFI